MPPGSAQAGEHVFDALLHGLAELRTGQARLQVAPGEKPVAKLTIELRAAIATP